MTKPKLLWQSLLMCSTILLKTDAEVWCNTEKIQCINLFEKSIVIVTKN